MYSVKNSVPLEKLYYFCGAEIYLYMYMCSRYKYIYFVKELILLEKGIITFRILIAGIEKKTNLCLDNINNIY